MSGTVRELQDSKGWLEGGQWMQATAIANYLSSKYSNAGMTEVAQHQRLFKLCRCLASLASHILEDSFFQTLLFSVLLLYRWTYKVKTHFLAVRHGWQVDRNL